MTRPSPAPSLEFLRPFRRVGQALLDLALPPTCLGCGIEMATPHGLCGDCWQSVTFLGTPACARCWLPFPYDAGTDALCPACIATESAIDRLRAAFVYDDKSRGLVLSFKHADRLQGAPAFGRWLMRAAEELIGGNSILVPVPLHWTRLFGRRYNQSALLCQALRRELLAAKGSAPDYAPRLLVRRRRTRPQGKLGRMSRQENVRGAFALGPGTTIDGAHVVLVDDVFTTGATVEECARILKRHGAARVDVLTLARVVLAGG